MVEFAGWQMPVQYTGVIEEHRAVRTATGLFDVSHMGELRVAGDQDVAHPDGSLAVTFRREPGDPQRDQQWVIVGGEEGLEPGVEAAATPASPCLGEGGALHVAGR